MSSPVYASRKEMLSRLSQKSPTIIVLEIRLALWAELEHLHERDFVPTSNDESLLCSRNTENRSDHRQSIKGL